MLSLLFLVTLKPMKRLLGICLGLLVSFGMSGQDESSGALSSGKFLIDAGLGFGVEIAQTNVDDDSVSTGGAVPGLLHLRVSYAITPKFMAHIRMERHGYASAPEDSIMIGGGSFSIGGSYVFLNNPKHTMDVGLMLGSSSLTITPTSASEEANDVYYSSTEGSTVTLNVGGRTYGNSGFGIMYELSWTSRTYQRFDYHDNSMNPKEGEWRTTKNTLNPNDDEAVELGLAGMNIRVGVSYRF